MSKNSLDGTGAATVPNEDRWSDHEGQRFAHRLLVNRGSNLPPTLFVGGAFQTMDSWARFVRSFLPYSSVLLVDPPGMGRSDVLPADRGVDLLASCLVRVLDEYEIAVVNVVAASYGTPTAFRLAQLHPERVGRVALAGTMRRIPDHLREQTRRSVDLALGARRDELAEVVIDGLLCRDLRRPVERRSLAERVLRHGIVRMDDRELLQYATNTTRLLEQEPLTLRPVIEGPEALVFTGEHDCYTVPEHCREVARAFARSWFTLVHRADHLFHIERFDVVVDLLLRFMQGRIADQVEGCAPVSWEGRPSNGGTVQRSGARALSGA